MEKELDLILDEFSEGNMTLLTLKDKLLGLYNVSRIIFDLKLKIYDLVNKNEGMLVKDFQELPDVKEIYITVGCLEKYYG